MKRDRTWLIPVVGGILIIWISVWAVSANIKQTETQRVQNAQVAQQNASQNEVNNIILSSVRLEHHSFDPQNSYEITGKVTNDNSSMIESFYIDVNAYDCPTKTITSTCTKVGEDNVLAGNSGSIYAGFPSGQVREFLAFASFDGMPSIQGNLLWNYSVSSVEK